MPRTATAAPVEAIRDAAIPLSGGPHDLDPLLNLVGEARFALIGEASHGTHEFYALRAELTKRLITERGFRAVAVEADWPDAYRVNRYVRGRGNDNSPEEALADFTRFPRWMWRNTIVVDFIAWLRAHNAALPYPQGVGFYGIDLYSLYSSADAVVRYLEGVDPEAARRARERYGCFETFEDDPQRYGQAVGYGFAEGCEDAVIQQLTELRQKAGDYASRDGYVAEDELFYAQQNAVLVQNAERYYRQMFTGRVNTWNLRDSHMADTLASLAEHLSRQGPSGVPAKVVVWAHNSHLGDARATYMGRMGEHNVGQLVRERWGTDSGGARLIGFTTYTGTVTAADNWDEPAQFKHVRPGLRDSVEELMHEAARQLDSPNFVLDLRSPSPAADALRHDYLERAIGVIYRPQTERQSHYFDCRVADQFDALIHLDTTRALEPLDRTSGWHDAKHGHDPYDTYPFGV